MEVLAGFPGFPRLPSLNFRLEFFDPNRLRGGGGGLHQRGDGAAELIRDHLHSDGIFRARGNLREPQSA